MYVSLDFDDKDDDGGDGHIDVNEDCRYDDDDDEKGTFAQRGALESCTWVGPPLVGWRPRNI